MAKQEKNKETVEEKKETPKKQAKPKAVPPKEKHTPVAEKKKKTATAKKEETKETKEKNKKEAEVAKPTTKKEATSKEKSKKTETNSKTSKQKSSEPKKEEHSTEANKKQETIETQKQERVKQTNSKSKNTASKDKQITVKKSKKTKQKQTNHSSKNAPTKGKQEDTKIEKKKNHTQTDTNPQTENNTHVETADELISVPEEELKKVKEERKVSKRLTKEQTEILKKNAFHNFLAAIGMTAYFVLLTLAFERMKPEVFMLDLKVFSGTFLATAILLFESAYKKDEGKWAIHGIEVLVIAIITLLLTHIYVIAQGRFTFITLLLAGSAIAYYCIKCLVMVIRQIRKSKLQDVKKLLAEKSEIDTKERME